MEDEFEIVLKICGRASCEAEARWELWTAGGMYYYYCDKHKMPEDRLSEGWEQRWRPEGVLRSGSIYVIKDAF